MHVQHRLILPIAVACMAMGFTGAVLHGVLDRAGPAPHLDATGPVRRGASASLGERALLRLTPPDASRVLTSARDAAAGGEKVSSRGSVVSAPRVLSARLQSLASALPDVTGKTRRRRVVEEMARLSERLDASMDASLRALLQDQISGLEDPRLSYLLERSLTR